MDTVKNKTIVIRKSIKIGKPDIRISFSNQYNYRVSLIPIYKNDEIKFEAKYEMKEN